MPNFGRWHCNVEIYWRKIKYPNDAKEKSIYGKVIAEIMVCSEGTIIDSKIIKGIGGGCDEEANGEVIKRYDRCVSKWIPGKTMGDLQQR